jgi:hypothetical protein
MMISQLDGITVTILASPINDFTIGRVLCVGTGHAGPASTRHLPWTDGTLFLKIE